MPLFSKVERQSVLGKNKNKSTLNRSTEYYHQSTFEVAKDGRCVKLVKEKKKHFDEWEL